MSNKATLTELFKRSQREFMKSVATSITGHVLAFDPVTQHAQIQIGVLRIDVNGKTITPPPLIEVPVTFIGGSEYTQEHQLDVGSEGIIHFSQRCIDGWKTTGGVANNPILRFHDLQDAMFVPGLRSQPNVITNHANDGIRWRNKDATHYVWLKNDGTIVSQNDNASHTIAPDGTVTTDNGTVVRIDSPDGTMVETNGTYTRTVNPDGSMNETNGAYVKTAAVDGTVNINGFIITPVGAASSPVSVTAPTVTGSSSLVVAGTEVKEHTHDKGTYLDAEDRPLKSGDTGAL